MIKSLTIEVLGSLLLALFTLLHGSQCVAATPHTTPDSLVYSLYFRQGDDLLMKDYRGNNQALNAMAAALTKDNSSNVLKINIIGSASPDGIEEWNDQLSLRRAESVRGYIIWQWEFTNQQAIQITRQTDYLSTWITAVENNPSVPRKDKVLEILHSNASVQTKWANIQLLSGDAASYIEQNIFPQLRNAVACVITLKDTKPTTVRHDITKTTSDEKNGETVVSDERRASVNTTGVIVSPEQVTESATQEEGQQTGTKSVVKTPKSKERCVTDHRYAIKTNLLQGAVALAPNLGFEYSLANRSTIELTGALNHWGLNGSSENNKKLAHWVLQTEYRYWLDQSFHGHFFGIHASGGKYNISGYTLPNLFAGGNIMESQYRYTGWMLGAGVSYGYLLRFDNHWGMEFNIGIGVAYLNYDKYDCVRCGRKMNSETKTYLGPTKAGISLIYSF